MQGEVPMHMSYTCVLLAMEVKAQNRILKLDTSYKHFIATILQLHNSQNIQNLYIIICAMNISQGSNKKNI